jgi:putative addiction module antidote
MIIVTVQQIDTSIGVALPPETVTRLDLTPGQVMALIEEPDGFRIATLNPEMERQVKAMNKVLREQFNVLRELAKR